MPYDDIIYKRISNHGNKNKNKCVHFVKDSISNDGLLQFKLESLIKAFTDTNCLHLIGIKENGRDDDLISDIERGGKDMRRRRMRVSVRVCVL